MGETHIRLYPVKLQLQAVGFYSLSPPLWVDHNTLWEHKILPAVCTSKFSIPTKQWSNDESLEQKKQGDVFAVSLVVFQMCNNINEIVSSGPVILLFIPQFLIGLLFLCIQ